jgi:hypothetical protein
MTLLTQRQPRVEDPAWLALVRQMPCLVCGYPRSDPAHLRTGSRQYGKRQCGMGEKPDDWWVLPLCRTHHRAQHDRGDEMAWWASVGIPDPHGHAKALYATRPPELRPLPAPARRKKSRAAEPRHKPAARTKIAVARKIPARKTKWATRELRGRNDLRRKSQ